MLLYFWIPSNCIYRFRRGLTKGTLPIIFLLFISLPLKVIVVRTIEGSKVPDRKV